MAVHSFLSDLSAQVFVVDGDMASRRALREALEPTGVAVRSFAGATEFLDSYQGQPGCVIAGLRLPDMTGLDLLAHLEEKLGHRPAMVIATAYGDVSSAVAAMKQGVVDFLEKPVSPAALAAAVQRALRQDALDRQRRDARTQTAGAITSLTTRQREILSRLLSGQPNKQIALDLGLSEKTVSTHRTHILRKFGTTNLLSIAPLLRRAGAPPAEELPSPINWNCLIGYFLFLLQTSLMA